MDIVTAKLLAAAFLLVIGLVGGFMPLWLLNISENTKDIANCFAGGILLAVALVHMLGDAAGDLEAAGAAFSLALGGEGDFPLGNALLLLGFFFLIAVETLLHQMLGGGHEHDHAHGENDGGHGDELLSHGGKESNTAGWAAVIGLSIHSFMEGIAMGAVDDMDSAVLLITAVACHKGFAAFANSSVNMPLVRNKRFMVWAALVVWFAVSGPLALVLGLALAADLEGAAAAGVTAFAGGTLLAVGVTEMLQPAFSKPSRLGWKLFASFLSLVAMTLIGVWV